MATLGQQLKESREEKSISLQEIAESTHISIRFLQAIENDAYDVLPGGVFNRAFIRKFARHVGFDEEQAVSLYEEQLQEQGGEPERGHPLLGAEEFDSRQTSGNGPLISFVALIVLGAMAYAAWQFFTPPPDTGGISIAGLNPTPSPRGGTPMPQATAMSSSNPASGSPTPGATASPTPSPTPEASPGAMRMQVTATIENVWVRVKADDNDAKEMELQPGESREFDANEQVILWIGRVQSLKITINGGEIDYAKLLPNPKATVARNVVITKDNYQQYLN